MSSSPPASHSHTSIQPAISTPTHGLPSNYGSFSILAKTTIAASPLTVLNAIRDTSTWAKWNSFTPRYTFTSGPTTKSEDNDLYSGAAGWLDLHNEGLMDVHMSGDGLHPNSKASRRQGMVVSVCEEIYEPRKKGYRIAWVSRGYAHWQLHTERVTELLATPDGQTAYTCYETFGGILCPAVRWFAGGTLVTRFGDYADGLREYCEKEGKGEGDGVSVVGQL